MRKTLLALAVVGGSLAGMSATVFAQTAAAPQTLATQDWAAQQAPVFDYYGPPASPRLYNEVPQYRTHAGRHYRHTGE